MIILYRNLVLHVELAYYAHRFSKADRDNAINAIVSMFLENRKKLNGHLVSVAPIDNPIIHSSETTAMDSPKKYKHYLKSNVKSKSRVVL